MTTPPNLYQVVQGATVSAPDINQLVQAFQAAYLVNGPVVQIATQTVTATTASVTFSNIPQYNHLFMMWQARSTNASASTDIQVRINGDSTANYYDVRVAGFNSTAFSDFVSAGTSMRIAEIAAASAAGTQNVGAGFAAIPGFGFSQNQLTGFSIGGYAVNIGATGSAIESYNFSYGVAPGPYTSITFFPAAGSFAGAVAPCTFTLYGSM